MPIISATAKIWRRLDMSIIRTSIFVLLSLFAAFAPCAAEDYGPTARGMFAMLPPSIFENTPAGLDEAAKQDLLLEGASRDWEIVGETPDTMVFAELPFREKYVALRIFHNDKTGGADAAIGTLGDPVCTVELWRLDAHGRIAPVDTPEEPDIREFFSRKNRAAKNRRNSVLICLGLGGLMAKPVFWNREGIFEPEVDNEISYQWTGGEFEKIIRRRPVNTDDSGANQSR